MKDMQGDVVGDVNHLCVCVSENVRFNVQKVGACEKWCVKHH